jgi:hypothetical protein
MEGKKKWVWVSKVNAIYAQAKLPDMSVSDALKMLRAEGAKASDVGEVMRESKYGSFARLNGWPASAMPVGKYEADPPPPPIKKRVSLWRPL